MKQLSRLFLCSLVSLSALSFGNSAQAVSLSGNGASITVTGISWVTTDAVGGGVFGFSLDSLTGSILAAIGGTAGSTDSYGAAPDTFSVSGQQASAAASGNTLLNGYANAWATGNNYALSYFTFDAHYTTTGGSGDVLLAVQYISSGYTTQAGDSFTSASLWAGQPGSDEAVLANYGNHAWLPDSAQFSDQGTLYLPLHIVSEGSTTGLLSGAVSASVVSAIPEPSAGLSMLVGLCLLGLTVRRRTV